MREDNSRLHRYGLHIRGALMHPSRRAILDYLARDRVGVGEDELAAALDLTTPRVRYHLRVLNQAHLISQVEDEWTRRAGGSFYVSTVA